MENIHEESVKAAICSFKPYKSPGRDGIYPVLLQKGINSLKKILVTLYRKSITEGVIPSSWMKSRIAFIPKPGKSDACSPKSFRPITLSSFLLKGLEKIIEQHLNRNFFNKENFFHKNLYSYQEGISTEDALHNIVYRIEKAFEYKQIAVVVFLDIEAAFNTVSIESMIRTLIEHGVDEITINWIEYMLKNRTIYANMYGEEVSKNPESGAPQGGILSAKALWNTVMNVLLKRYPKLHPVILNLFADDGAKVCIGIDLETIINVIQKDIPRLEKWAADMGLKFAPGKTKAMIFSSNKTLPVPKKNIKMGNTDIEWVENFKYLGVTLDQRLSFKTHSEKVAKRAMITWANVRKMIGTNWGLNPEIARWSYLALVRPLLSYGSIVWANRTDNEDVTKNLRKVQRQALLTITNGMASTPTAGMETMANIPPIEIHIQKTALNTYKRMRENKTWRPQEGEIHREESHSLFVKRLASGIPDFELPKDKVRFKEMIDTKFTVIIDTRKEWEGRVIRPTPTEENIVNCFTDGSKNEDSSGCAHIIRGKDLELKGYRNLGSYCTVFQTEITALADTAENLLRNEVKGKTINIYSDSQAALKSLGNYIIHQKTVTECKKLLNEVTKENQLNLHWIPSHIGHRGNEIADRLAKLGTGTNTYGPALLVPVSASHSRQALNKWEKQQQQIYWENLESCRQSKMFMPKTGISTWKSIKNLNRKQMKIFCHISTGHCVLRRHLFLMKEENRPTCQQCDENEEETAYHFMAKCPKFNNIRYQIFRKQFLEEESLKNLKVADILKYIKRTKRYDEFLMDF